MNGKYSMDRLPNVMGKMGINVAKNIQEVNNSLLDGMPCTIDNVEFKPRYNNEFSVTRTVNKQKKVWRAISTMNVARALDRHAAGMDVDEHRCRVISHDLQEGDTVEFRGLKLKPDSKGGFRIYDNRDKVQDKRPFGAFS